MSRARGPRRSARRSSDPTSTTYRRRRAEQPADERRQGPSVPKIAPARSASRQSGSCSAAPLPIARERTVDIAKAAPRSTRLHRPSCAHGKRRRLSALKSEVAHQADEADDDDAEDDLVGRQQRLAVGDHVADAARGADQLGDDDVGPGPAEHHAQHLGDLGRGAGQQDAPDQAAVGDAQRVGRLDQVAPRVADVTAIISTSWKKLPMKMTASFCASPMPAHRISSGMKALAGR